MTKRFSKALSSNFIIFGIVGTVFALSFVITERYISFAILQLISAGVLTVREGVQIDTQSKVIRTFKSIFFIEWGDNVEYQKLDGLFLKSGLYSQGMSTRGSSHTIKYTLYTVSLYADDLEYELKSSKKGERMEVLIEELSKELDAPILE